jgi:hypothetical protein
VGQIYCSFYFETHAKYYVEDIKQWVQEDDIFTVDICFRDSLELLEDLGIKTEMPSFMIKGQKQM